VAARLVITNAAAGGSDAEAIEAAVAELRSDGQVQVAASGSAAELDRILEQRGDDIEIIVAMGGDGSLHALANALHRRGELTTTTVGLVPLGTGNDFARGVGISLDPCEAARQHLDGVVRRIDVVVDDRDTLIVNAVHVGIGADAVREAGVWKRRLGRLGYVVGAVKAGVTSPGLALRVRVDREDLRRRRGKVIQVAIGNGAYVGGGTELAPGARPYDGLVDVVVAYADAPLARLGYAIRLRRGTHVDRDDVISARGSSVNVTGEPFWCNADGELSGPYRSMSWFVKPGALAMVLPRA